MVGTGCFRVGRGVWVGAVGAALVAACCESQDLRGWRLTLDAVSVDSNLDVPAFALPAGVDLSSDETDTGFALAARYRFSRRIEVELGYLDGGESSLDLTAQVLQQSLRVESRLGFEALIAGLDVHLTPGHRVQLYAGPLLAFLRYGDVRPTLDLRLDPAALPLPVPLPVLLGLLPELPIDADALLQAPLELRLRLPGVDVDDDFAAGLGAGVDVPLGTAGRWLFNAAVRYLDSSVEGPLGTELDLEPILVGVGLSYRL